MTVQDRTITGAEINAAGQAAAQGAEAASAAAVSAMQDAARRGADTFWSQQERLLSSMQELAQGWFQRRHEGAQAALTCSQRICAAKSPAEAIGEYQTWAKGAMERVMADTLALQQQMTRLSAQTAQEARRQS